MTAKTQGMKSRLSRQLVGERIRVAEVTTPAPTNRAKE
jgi:hypothetical protein